MIRSLSGISIISMADIMAIGAIRALRDAGLRVPEDVSVMGFDGLLIGRYMIPTLSTIRQSVDELAEQSIRLLQENMETHQAPRYETVPVAVELRESIRDIQ